MSKQPNEGTDGYNDNGCGIYGGSNPAFVVPAGQFPMKLSANRSILGLPLRL